MRAKPCNHYFTGFSGMPLLQSAIIGSRRPIFAPPLWWWLCLEAVYMGTAQRSIYIAMEVQSELAMMLLESRFAGSNAETDCSPAKHLNPSKMTPVPRLGRNLYLS